MRHVVVALPDGARLALRGISPDDQPLLLRGFERLSERSRRQRFLVPTSRLTRSQLAYLSNLDYRNHVAWGVLDEGMPVGLGRWVRLPGEPETGDVALTVVDAYQGRGVGLLLLGALRVAAEECSIRRFKFDVLADNGRMLRLLGRLRARLESGEGLVTGVVDVENVPPPVVVDGDLRVLLEEMQQPQSSRSSSRRAAEFMQ